MCDYVYCCCCFIFFVYQTNSQRDKTNKKGKNFFSEASQGLGLGFALKLQVTYLCELICHNGFALPLFKLFPNYDGALFSSMKLKLNAVNAS